MMLLTGIILTQRSYVESVQMYVRTLQAFENKWFFCILRGGSLFVPFLKKGNTKNFYFFERAEFKMHKVKEQQFLVGVRGQRPCNKNHATSQRAKQMVSNGSRVGYSSLLKGRADDVCERADHSSLRSAKA